MNNKKNDWNPQEYLKYKNERTQPAIDLIARINIYNPKKIIDIGCGPGNSTQMLRKRWPDSQITGLDSSPNMIEKAKSDYPKQDWILADAAQLGTDTIYDIIFSNASLQWIPNHEQLIEKLLSIIDKRGALAMQIPRFDDMPLSNILRQTACKPKWSNTLSQCNTLFTFHDYKFYYNVLEKHCCVIDMWETFYIHILNSQEAILDWSRTTGMKPYLDRLETDEMKNEFEKDVLLELGKEYPVQKNGKVLFPFKRLLIIAYK